MKKIKYILVTAAYCILLTSFMQINNKPDKSIQTDGIKGNNNIQVISSAQTIANNVRTWFRNNGSFNRDPSTGNSGFEWPVGSNKFARYASGMWLGAVTGGDTLVCIAEYDYEYLNGYIDNSGQPQGRDDPNYRIYSILRGDTVSWDYITWPFQQGAYSDSLGKPLFLGTQTMFYSFTDGYPESHGNNAGSTSPLKAVILQTNWCYSNVNLRDVVFSEFRIINRSFLPWNNTYISIWTDDDLGTSSDDAVGIDTNLKMSYTYNFNATDPLYGTSPPAVGFLTLRNPIVPSPGDTVRYYSPPGTSYLIVKPGYREMKLSSFNLYTNADPYAGDPSNYIETYNNLQGLKRNGSAWINPQNSQSTKFPYPGDPVTSTGWTETGSGDRRSMMNFGPLTMNPGDTQSVIVAQLIAGYSSNLENIANLRSLANYVRGIYNTNFQSVISVETLSTEVPDRFSLEQNYPNPFNPVTNLEFRISKLGFVSLKIYDVLGKEVKTLVNEKLSPGNYKVEFDGSNLTSGVYFYRLTAGEFTDTKRMMLVK